MRLLVVGLALAALSVGAAHGGERPVAVVVTSFAAPDALAIFAPEVARAVAGNLQQAGVDIALFPSAAAVTVTGRIDSVDAERVRLSATIGPHTVQAEGPLERVDALAADLAHRLVALVPAGARHAPPHLAHEGPRGANWKKGGPLAAFVPPSPVGTAGAPAAATPVSNPVTTAPAATSPAAPTAAANAPAPSTATPEPAAATPATPVPAATATPPATGSSDPASAPPAPTPTTTPTPRPANGAAPFPANIPDPGSLTPPPLADKPPPAPRPADPGYEALAPPRRRGDPHRVVLHTVRMPDGCATGAAATFAAREAIERRAGLRVVAGGCGIAPPGSAVAEASRAGAASVVMASFEWIRYEPMMSGVRPFGRLRVVVVRDGRAALVQTLDVSTRAVALPTDANRVAYDLAAAAFAQLGATLDSALAPGDGEGDATGP